MKKVFILFSVITFFGCTATKHETSNPLKIGFQIQNLWQDLMPTVLHESKIYADFDLDLTNLFDFDITGVALENFKILNEQKSLSLPLYLPNTSLLQNLTFGPNENKKFQIRSEANPHTSKFLINNERFHISFDIRNKNNLVFNYVSPRIRIEKVY
ncbi:MAG: hypothetical protein FJ213_00850 [Ignavibacteria bacterium]|nr:hypothetical protein [Ignavibacteria bacterium]